MPRKSKYIPKDFGKEEEEKQALAKKKLRPNIYSVSIIPISRGLKEDFKFSFAGDFTINLKWFHEEYQNRVQECYDEPFKLVQSLSVLRQLKRIECIHFSKTYQSTNYLPITEALKKIHHPSIPEILHRIQTIDKMSRSQRNFVQQNPQIKQQFSFAQQKVDQILDRYCALGIPITYAVQEYNFDFNQLEKTRNGSDFSLFNIYAGEKYSSFMTNNPSSTAIPPPPKQPTKMDKKTKLSYLKFDQLQEVQRSEESEAWMNRDNSVAESCANDLSMLQGYPNNSYKYQGQDRNKSNSLSHSIEIPNIQSLNSKNDMKTRDYFVTTSLSDLCHEANETRKEGHKTISKQSLDSPVQTNAGVGLSNNQDYNLNVNQSQNIFSKPETSAQLVLDLKQKATSLFTSFADLCMMVDPFRSEDDCRESVMVTLDSVLIKCLVIQKTFCLLPFYLYTLKIRFLFFDEEDLRKLTHYRATGEMLFPLQQSVSENEINMYSSPKQSAKYKDYTPNYMTYGQFEIIHKQCSNTSINDSRSNDNIHTYIPVINSNILLKMNPESIFLPLNVSTVPQQATNMGNVRFDFNASFKVDTEKESTKNENIYSKKSLPKHNEFEYNAIPIIRNNKVNQTQILQNQFFLTKFYSPTTLSSTFQDTMNFAQFSPL